MILWDIWSGDVFYHLGRVEGCIAYCWVLPYSNKRIIDLGRLIICRHHIYCLEQTLSPLFDYHWLGFYRIYCIFSLYEVIFNQQIDTECNEQRQKYDRSQQYNGLEERISCEIHYILHTTLVNAYNFKGNACNNHNNQKVKCTPLLFIT